MSYKKVYFIGIGGIGISSLARWFLALKWLVFGSDLINTSLLQELKKDGVKVKIGHKKANLPTLPTGQAGGRQVCPDLVIYSQAIKPDNSELLEAKKRGIKTFTYPQFLGELTRYYKTIAVSGAHGKSTTTALIALILIKAGFDPTVIIGTKFKDFSQRPAGNFRSGKSEYLVMEADEWKAAFLNYSPALAIITNIDREHLDYYKNLADIKNTFLKFIKNIQPGGILILNKDNKNLTDLAHRIKKISSKNNLKIFWYGLKNPNQSNICRQIKKVLKVAGQHNLSNALAAYVLARALKIKTGIILKALAGYTGTWRRMEYKGKFQISAYAKASADKQKSKFPACAKSSAFGRRSRLRLTKSAGRQIPVYDDYAHHPTEIKATLSTLREKYPKGNIICVFQPHQAKRLQLLFKDFINCFNDADYLVLLPIYQVAGRDKVSQNINSKKLTEKINQKLCQSVKDNKAGIVNGQTLNVTAQRNRLRNHNRLNELQKLKKATYLPHPKKLPAVIKNIIRNHSRYSHSFVDSHYVIVMMGAGDIANYTKLLISH